MGDARGRLIIVKAPASVREAADVVAEVVVHEQTGLIAAPADTTTKQTHSESQRDSGGNQLQRAVFLNILRIFII